MSTASEVGIDAFMRRRGVGRFEPRCPACKGFGARRYSHGSTWRGGMGVAASTWDQCDQCWGSGVEGRPWPSVRELGVQRADWEAEQVYEYLRERLGIRFFAKRIMSLADMADRETKRRKFPEGEDPFFFTRDWESVSALLRKLAAKDPQP